MEYKALLPIHLFFPFVITLIQPIVVHGEHEWLDISNVGKILGRQLNPGQRVCSRADWLLITGPARRKCHVPDLFILTHDHIAVVYFFERKGLPISIVVASAGRSRRRFRDLPYQIGRRFGGVGECRC